MAGPVEPRLYSTRNDIGLDTEWLSSAICNKQKCFSLVNSLDSRLTERNAWIRSALTVAKGFPLTRIVNVSSFSVVIREPNQDFFVSSGDDSGVKCTSSDEAGDEKESVTNSEQTINGKYLAVFFDGNGANQENCF